MSSSVSIRLIAIDIDGTLLDGSGNIPAENRRAIAAALDRGIEVALVTGRGFTFARPIAERLDLPVVLSRATAPSCVGSTAPRCCAA